MHSTPVSLLARLRQPGDKTAWLQFVQLYTPLLYRWGRKAGLQPADAGDLTQDVFAALWQKMPSFNYDGSKSFRSWLRTVALNSWRDRYKRRATRPLPPDNGLQTRAAADPFESLIENEYTRHVAGRALELMQADFETNTWKAFWESVVAGRPSADVAKELGMSTGAIYAAKFRVLQRLRQELDGLLE